MKSFKSSYKGFTVGRFFTFLLVIIMVCVAPASQNSITKTNNPETACNSLRTMARLYMAQGAYQSAKPYIEKSLKIASAENVSYKQLAMSLLDAAWLYRGLGDYQQALDMGSDALAVFSVIHQPGHPDIAATLKAISSIHRKIGLYELALDEITSAMKMKIKNPDNPSDLATYRVEIAALLTDMGLLKRAKRQYALALETVEKTFGQNHLYTATVRTSFAKMCILDNDIRTAKTLIEKAYRTQKNVYGTDHPKLINTWLVQSVIAEEMGKANRAHKLLDRALKTSESENGPIHPSTGKILDRLSTFYYRNAKPQAAFNTAIMAVDVLKQTLGKSHPKTAEALNNLAIAWLMNGQTSQAQLACKDACDTLMQKVSPKHPNCTIALETMAKIYRKKGDFEQSAFYLEKAGKLKAAAVAASVIRSDSLANASADYIQTQ
jgi:tetratricopeptide (TPR) repeat protein